MITSDTTRLKNEKTHAINRARERYGLDLSRSDLDEIQARLRAGEGENKFYRRNRTRVDLPVCGVRCRLLVRQSSKRVLTFLPTDLHCAPENTMG